MSFEQVVDVSKAAVPAGRPMRVVLWVAQTILAALFCLFGFMKLTTPINELSAMMPWTGQVPLGFVRFIGGVDLLGGLGIILPSVTRIRPHVTVAAAVGCIALQILAFAFHAVRGEFPMLPLNIILLALSAFVLYGRGKRVPIAPRR